MSEIIRVEGIKKYFDTPHGLLHAVDDVTFSIEEGETLGVVGESGCGKSTLGRTILNLIEPTAGKIVFRGEDISNVSSGNRYFLLRREMQLIFQDPFSSLNPRMSVRDAIAEPLKIHKIYNTREEMDQRISELMDTVGLASRLAYAYPHELDGGRRQRIGIARALALRPKFIVCDEPVSALDVSIQAQVLNLLQDLQEEFKLTYLFITHDLSVVKHISNDILVMYLGKMVEKADSDEIFAHPLHPYTKALLAAIPLPVVRKNRKRELIKGEVTSPINPKPGCRFAARCPYAQEKCHQTTPELKEVLPDHVVACHFCKEINNL